MPQFARPVDQRLGELLRALAQRVTRLEQRTAPIDTGSLVCALVGAIPGSYTSGRATVVPVGQTSAIGPFPSLSSYTPHAGDTVLLLPLGQSYVIVGTFS